MLLPLLGQLRVARPVSRPRTRPDEVLGDKAYSLRAIRTHIRTRGIKTVIPEPADQQGHRKRRASRGGRPVGLDAAVSRAAMSSSISTPDSSSGAGCQPGMTSTRSSTWPR